MAREIPSNGECQKPELTIVNVPQHIGEAMAFHACNSCTAFEECFEGVVTQEEAELIYQVMKQDVA